MTKAVNNVFLKIQHQTRWQNAKTYGDIVADAINNDCYGNMDNKIGLQKDKISWKTLF